LAATLSGALLAVAPAVPARAADDGQGPIVAYTFDSDDLAGGVVADSSGHGLDGALVNGATAALVDGAGGGHALQLPGGASTSAGAYVSLPKAILDGRTDLTVSARVRWDGTTAPWQWIYALGKDTSCYLFTTPFNGDGLLRTAVTSNYAGAEAQVTGSAALPANAWKTITVTLDSTAGRVTTYLDGAAVSSAPTTVTASQLIDSATTSAGFLGRSFYPDPLFDGAIDDFRVYGRVLSASEIGQNAPTATGLAQTTFDLRTTVGTAPVLPATVRAHFTDGYDRNLAITWPAIDPARYAQRGTFSVSGTAGGIAVSATVTVIREGEITVDLSKTTGKFHGGAAGSLYGLYGDGVPTNNLIEGMHLRTVSTKAQDGPQHPGADALEVVGPLADSTGGDVYVYMTDIHRGFPYQWPGSTPAEKLATYEQKIATQVDQVKTLGSAHRKHVVFVPFNEPEGNMFGTGEWSYNGVSWLNNPADYFRAWDEAYHLIKSRMPDARIAGPNTSVLYGQVKGFLQHAKAAGTLPDVITWHELSHPEKVRQDVAQYRAWEAEVLPGTKLPININEYAFNYHTSVPGQMIQWISAIEESKVDADIAYWNIDGNISDSAVQANRGNGQWWLFNAYGGMTGDTVEVSPPYPGQNYTMQGVATLDRTKRQAHVILGGSAGAGYVRFAGVPAKVFGSTVHAWIREIPWTGQIGDSAPPRLIAEKDLKVVGDTVTVELNGLTESSAYEIVLTPAGDTASTSPAAALWQGSYEAENATYTGGGYSKNGPEGSTADVSKFYTSGGYDVGGLRTGSDGVLSFTVDVPATGRYDLSVFANSLNTYSLVRDQGPTNVFLRVDGAAEQELFLPLGYKWVVWDHTDTTVQLTKGRHTIALAARSLDGGRATRGAAGLRPAAPGLRLGRRRAGPRRRRHVLGLFESGRRVGARSETDRRNGAHGRQRHRRADRQTGRGVALRRHQQGHRHRNRPRRADRQARRAPGRQRARGHHPGGGERHPDRRRRGRRPTAGRRRSGSDRDHRRQHAHLLGPGRPARHVRAADPLRQPRAGRRHPLQPRPPRPARRHRGQRRDGQAGAVPEHLPRRQLLRTDRAGAAETRRQHDPVLVRRATQLRRHDVRLGHLAGHPAPVPVRPRHRQRDCRAVREGPAGKDPLTRRRPPGDAGPGTPARGRRPGDAGPGVRATGRGRRPAARVNRAAAAYARERPATDHPAAARRRAAPPAARTAPADLPPGSARPPGRAVRRRDRPGSAGRPGTRGPRPSRAPRARSRPRPPPTASSGAPPARVRGKRRRPEPRRPPGATPAPAPAEGRRRPRPAASSSPARWPPPPPAPPSNRSHVPAGRAGSSRRTAWAGPASAARRG
jgi:hypothetical protein